MRVNFAAFFSFILGVFEDFLSLGDSPFDNSVDQRKYGFWREGDAIILEIRNIDFGDAAT